MNNIVQYINPEGLFKNQAFTQVITTSGKGTTIYIGGQNAVNEKGEIAGRDIETQTNRVMENLQIALTACGAGFENLIKLSIFIVQGQDFLKAFAVSQKYLGHLKNQPAVSVLFVAGLANPDFLIEAEAIAIVPDLAD